MSTKVKIIEKRKGVIAYDCSKVFYIKLKKGTIVSDHNHNHKEVVFIMEGKAEVIIENKKLKIKAPAKLEIPSKVYHKFTAMTDLVGLEIK